MHATRRTWRRVMCSTGANRRKRSLQQTSSRIFTRQRASRNFSGCWMRRLRRGETTVRRGRRKMGHSIEAPKIHPHREPHSMCVCVCVRVCARLRERVESVFYQRGVNVTGHCMCWYEHVCVFGRMAKIVF